MHPTARDDQIARLIRDVAAWAKARDDIQAVALVGSRARGTARVDSDLDIVILTTQPSRYLEGGAWTDGIGVVLDPETERWGAVTSRRGTTGFGLEVEFGVTTPDWPGGERVLRDGYLAVHDPAGILAKLTL